MSADSMANVRQMEITIEHAQLLDTSLVFVLFCCIPRRALNFLKMKPWTLKYIWICGDFHVECRMVTQMWTNRIYCTIFGCLLEIHYIMSVTRFLPSLYSTKLRTASKLPQNWSVNSLSDESKSKRRRKNAKQANRLNERNMEKVLSMFIHLIFAM